MQQFGVVCKIAKYFEARSCLWGAREIFMGWLRKGNDLRPEEHKKSIDQTQSITKCGNFGQVANNEYIAAISKISLTYSQ